MSKEQDEAVDTYLRMLEVAFTVGYVGEVPAPRGWASDREKRWKVDQFTVTYKRGKEEMCLPYYMGLGNRKPAAVPTNYPAPKHVKHRWEKPVAPTAASVLHSLLGDADAATQSFSEWCGNMGYDDDSIKALHTYQQCEAVARDLRRLFKRDEVQRLQELLQDY